MAIQGRSILDLSNFTNESLFSLFEKAEQALCGKIKSSSGPRSHISLVFFENSTRTRMSFEAAAFKLGLFTSYFDHQMGTSLSKGESAEETLLNIAAMAPELVVVRAPGEFPLQDLTPQLPVPVINGGWGAKGHPTQALLDLFTLWRHWRDFESKKIVFIGDIRHSRVVQSHIEILSILGVEVAFCAPSSFIPEVSQQNQFGDVSEALAWADAAIVLRVQKERHSGQQDWDFAEFRAKFAVTTQKLSNCKASSFILHPGPYNPGVEIDSEVLSDKRCLILEQVKMGVFLRAALINEILDLKAIG